MYTHYQNETAQDKGSGRLQRWLSIAIAGVFIAVSLVVVASWYLRSSQLLSVQTGSMAPAIQPGDAVLTKKVGLEDLRPGDVVSFHGQDNPQPTTAIITHRVIGVDAERRTIQTQGDNNATADRPIDVASLVGRVERLLPNVGYVLDFVHSRAGLTLGVYAPAAIIVFAELRRLTEYYQPGYRHHSRA